MPLTLSFSDLLCVCVCVCVCVNVCALVCVNVCVCHHLLTPFPRHTPLLKPQLVGQWRLRGPSYSLQPVFSAPRLLDCASLGCGLIFVQRVCLDVYLQNV